MRVNKIHTNNNVVYKQKYTGPFKNKVNQTFRKLLQQKDDISEIIVRRQPFKIPEKIQKYAKKVSDLIIETLDTL